MTTKRKSPYQRLTEIGRDFALDVLARRKVCMDTLELNNSPGLHSLYYRAIAAEQLEYEVILEARGGKIELIYRQKITQGHVPLEFLP